MKIVEVNFDDIEHNIGYEVESLTKDFTEQDILLIKCNNLTFTERVQLLEYSLYEFEWSKEIKGKLFFQLY